MGRGWGSKSGREVKIPGDPRRQAGLRNRKALELRATASSQEDAEMMTTERAGGRKSTVKVAFEAARQAGPGDPHGRGKACESLMPGREGDSARA